MNKCSRCGKMTDAIFGENCEKYCIKCLRWLVNHYDIAYYQKSKSEISDEKYDQLKALLRSADGEKADEKVAGGVSAGYKKVKHEHPVLSLASILDESGVRSWASRNQALANTSGGFVVQPKVDGLTVVLTYQGGKLVRAATRGDGEIGEDVTRNVLTVAGVPHIIPFMGKLIVRGECVVLIREFEKWNEKLEKAGKRTFANPRNAASGTLRQLDPSVTAEAPLTILFYDVMEGGKATRSEDINLLQELEFFTVASDGFPSIDGVITFCKRCATFREKNAELFPFEADGLVVKLDEKKYDEELGVSGKDPRHSLAFKFQARAVATRLLSVSVQVGRTGRLTPVANMEPAQVSGVTVRQATLHNWDYIKEKDIRIGDMVTLQRSGDVIPYVVGPIKASRTGEEKIIKPPTKCPSCGSPIIKDPDVVALVCPNKDCRERLIQRVSAFAKIVEIDGLGGGIVEMLVDAKLVKSLADLFRLRSRDLLKLSKFGERRTEKLLDAIAGARTTTLAQVIRGLGIDAVGNSASDAIAKAFTPETLLKVDELGLLAAGVTSKAASNLSGWLVNRQNRKELEEILSEMEVAKPKKPTKGALTGKTFVVTGTLSVPRKEIEALIEDNGGVLGGSVTRKTDYLVVGTDAGSKLVKAQSLNVPILSEKEFRNMV